MREEQKSEEPKKVRNRPGGAQRSSETRSRQKREIVRKEPEKPKRLGNCPGPKSSEIVREELKKVREPKKVQKIVREEPIWGAFG